MFQKNKTKQTKEQPKERECVTLVLGLANESILEEQRANSYRSLGKRPFVFCSEITVKLICGNLESRKIYMMNLWIWLEKHLEEC